MHLFIATVVALAFGAKAQELGLKPQTDTFNSNITITLEQAQAANLSSIEANNLAIAVNFERTNWANGSVRDDSFYKVPANSSGARPGSLLKVEVDANISAYTAAPNTALSRILFMTENLNGSAVPASAFILWPYIPRQQPDGSYPIVAWAHGVSGGFGECGPSHYRDLLYDFAAPFALAADGYVVVAPDFAGLGVNETFDGQPIVHQFVANPAGANDIFYSVQAAQTAFPSLSKQFVVMGHSQGGGVAWGAAERQAIRPVSGYLGAIAASPVTKYINQSLEASPEVSLLTTAVIARTLSSIFPGFNMSDLLTPLGLRRLELATELQGCNAVIITLFNSEDTLQTNGTSTYYPQSYQNLTQNGNKNISGPMLVLQGEADTFAPYKLTTNVVNETCTLFPDLKIEYLHFANVTHVPVLYASQRLYMQWIADRFAGVEVQDGCTSKRYSSLLDYEVYNPEINWFLEYATAPYEVA